MVIIGLSGVAALLAGKDDVRLPLNLPELVLYAEGMPLFWLFTAKGGELAGKVPAFCWLCQRDRREQQQASRDGSGGRAEEKVSKRE